VQPVALAFGATASVKYERIYPATINTSREALFAADVAQSLVGPDHVVRDMEPSMGAEDFSFMLQVKPGAYLRIGQGGEGSCFLHNSRYDFNDDILPLGSALHAGLIEQSHAAGRACASSVPYRSISIFQPSSPAQGAKDEIQTQPDSGRRVLRRGRHEPGCIRPDGAHRQPGRRALSMDPHSLNESLQLTVTGNVYEPLVGRNKDLSLAPALATSWKQTSPTVWRFELRRGVQFHDGTPFTADDVLFSFARTQVDGSDMKSYTNDFKEVRKINDYTIEIETKAPFPILPDVISLVYIMSKKWCETNQAARRWTAARASRTPHPSAPTAPARTACASASPTCARPSCATATTGARSRATSAR
jgi:hypothetical protein